MKAACIILTAGTRPAQTAHAVASCVGQTGADVETILIANGCEPPEVPDGVRIVHLPEHQTVPAARNRGAEATAADVLLFLDDDASYPREDLVAEVLRRFEAEPDLGVLSFRIDDPTGRPRQRRHVPRLRVGDPTCSSEVTSFLEGACAIRRSAWDAAGAYPESFEFGHYGTDLAWRVIDAGYRVRYAGDVAVHHPADPPTRHPGFFRTTVRSRMFLARRLLPWPLMVVYSTVWFVLTLARARSMHAVRDLLGGVRDGLRDDPGERRPISWQGVWRMTRAGRPPVI